MDVRRENIPHNLKQNQIDLEYIQKNPWYPTINLWSIIAGYPLVNVYMTMENHHVKKG